MDDAVNDHLIANGISPVDFPRLYVFVNDAQSNSRYTSKHYSNQTITHAQENEVYQSLYHLSCLFRWWKVNTMNSHAFRRTSIMACPPSSVAASSCEYRAPLSHPIRVCVGLRIKNLGKSSADYRIAIFDGVCEWGLERWRLSFRRVSIRGSNTKLYILFFDLRRSHLHAM